VRRSVVGWVVAWTALVAWAVFWFWAFSFAYSDSFFLYDRHARVPTFVAALVTAVLVPVSAAIQWRAVSRGRNAFMAFGLHAVSCVAALSLLPIVSGLLRRAGEPWRLSADDAMGVGIDFLLLLGIAIASGLVLAVALFVRSRARTRRSG